MILTIGKTLFVRDLDQAGRLALGALSEHSPVQPKALGYVTWADTKTRKCTQDLPDGRADTTFDHIEFQLLSVN